MLVPFQARVVEWGRKGGDLLDTSALRQAVAHFVFSSKPSNGDGSAPCTVKDINRVVENLGEVLNTFIDELESE